MNRHLRRALRSRQHGSSAVRTAAKLDVDEDRPEKAEQREVCRLYEALGLEVVSLSQPRATMQTEGIPDLKIYCLRKGITWWFECKRRKGGKQSDAQSKFQRQAERCGETYLIGGYTEAYAHLEEIGVIVKGVA